MEMALKAGDLAAAQLVAAECVVDAETKDHQNWELIGQVGKKLKGDDGEPPCARPTRRSRTRKTSTCTTRPAGRGSCGSSRSACRRSFRRPRRRRT